MRIKILKIERNPNFDPETDHPNLQRLVTFQEVDGFRRLDKTKPVQQLLSDQFPKIFHTNAVLKPCYVREDDGTRRVSCFVYPSVL